MNRFLTAFALVATAALTVPAQAGNKIKAQTGQVKALSPQPLPPVENPARSSTVSPTKPNVRALSPQPLPPREGVKAPTAR